MIIRAILLWLLLATPALAGVRALFVGIGDYPAEAAPGVAAPPRLLGPVNDVALLKAVLARRHGLDLGPMPAAGCRVETSVATTLIDACATRAAILAALSAQLAAAAPGDVMLFVFAGHGAATAGSSLAVGQAGRNSTILPFDARPAAGGGFRDIYDVELRDLLWRHQRRGVSVVTIFDSCSSGTATRDLRSDVRGRGVAIPAPRPPAMAGQEPPVPPGPAYLVHLAAVADEAVALEARFLPDDGLTLAAQHNGVFSRALALALTQLPANASYREVADRTGWLMLALGAAPPPHIGTAPAGLLPPRLADAGSVAGPALAAQQAQAEGTLGAIFLGAAPATARVFAAALDAAGLTTPGAGGLSGLAVGSGFSVHCGLAAAEAGRDVVATATVSAVAPGSARLTLAGRLPRCPAAAALALRETRRGFGGAPLHLGLSGASTAEAAVVAVALQDAGLVGSDDAGAAWFLRFETGPERCDAATGGDVPARTLALRAATGRLVNCLGAADAPGLAARIGAAVRGLAAWFAVLDLGRDGGDDLGTIAITRAGCDDAGSSSCGFVAGAANRVQVGERLAVSVLDARTPVYAYALMLDGRTLAIEPLSGAANTDDPAIPAAGSRLLFRGRFNAPGDLAVLVLASTTPIGVAALRQDPVRAAGGSPPGPLERLLQLAARGQRGNAEAGGTWMARLIRFAIAAPANTAPAATAPATTAPATTAPVAIRADAPAPPVSPPPISSPPPAIGSDDGGRIVNGDPASLDTAPWQLHLISRPATGEGWHCGAVLIRPDWVLTARHCLTRGDEPLRPAALMPQLTISGGHLTFLASDAGAGPTAQASRVDRIITHPAWRRRADGFTEGDIALLHLATPLQPRRTATGVVTPRPIALPPPLPGFPAGGRARIAGWGATAWFSTIANRPTALPPAETLRFAEIDILAGAACDATVGAVGPRPPRTLCAIRRGATERANATTCAGDSGGGLALPRGHGFVVVGLVSGAINCGRRPALFTRIGDYLPWIIANIGGAAAR